MKNSSLIPVERIEKAIYLIRGEKVMLDFDLAALYEVTTKAAKPGGAAQPTAFSNRLHVPAEGEGSR